MRVKIPSSIMGSIKIVGLYLLLGFLWILFSDQLTAWLVTDKKVFHQVSTYKGWGYVFVTGILLYFLIKNHTEKISTSEAWLRMAHDAADMGTWRYDIVAGKIFFDERSRKHYGFSEFEVSIADVISRVHPDDVSGFEQKIASSLDPVGGRRYTTMYRVVHPDESTHWLEIQADISFEGAGAKRRPIFGVGTSRDVTTSRRAELQVRYFSRLYATLSQVNQTIVRCHDQQELFDSICRLAVEFGEFRLAWVGLLDEETDMLLPVAEYGFQDNKLPFREMDLRKMPFRDGLMGLAFRSGRVEICNDIQVEPHMTHWREIAIRDQYHSAASVPIRRNSQVIGLLNLYAADIDFFMVMEEQRLLEEMSMDISYALDGMQLENQREQAMQEMREAEERFHKAFFSGPVGLAITRSSDGVYLDANPAFSRITGFSREELIGQTSLGLNMITPAQRQEYTRQIHENGFIRDQEMILRSKTGEELIVLGAMEIIELNNEVCVLSTAIDITERKEIDEALIYSERRFRSLIENSLDNISLLAADGTLIWESPSTIRTLGYEENAFKGKNIFDLLHPDDAEWVGTQFRELLTQPRVTRGGIFRLQHADGSWRWIESLATNLLDEPSVKAIVINYRDVTERRQSETKIRESERRFRQLADNIEEVFWIYNPFEKRQVYISPAVEKIWMLPPQVFYDYPDQFYDCILPEDLAYVKSVTARQALGEKTEMQYRISRPDGTIRWIWDRSFPIFDENAKFISVAAILADITERKRAEIELLELNQNLERRVKERTAEVQDLYENAPTGYHSLDANGLFIRINQTELNWLGYTREEIVGIKSFFDLITSESQKVFDENFQRFKAQGWIKDLEFEMICKDGRTMPVLVNATAIYNERNEFLMSRSTLVDITERKQAEQQLQAANTALEKASKLKDEFLANMSHELRTPLNAVIGLSESLQANTYGELNSHQSKTLDVIRESGHHLLELINDILDLSKIEAGMMELQYESVDLKSICEASLIMVTAPARKKDLKVSLSISDKLQSIQADQRRLKQMIVNLLSNAVKFTPQFGSIGLEVLPENDHAVRFTVWDTGIGIPNEQLKNLFLPFAQVDSSLNRKYEGTGLGLALVRQLAEMHNGSIGVESIPEKGSSFYFIIPKQSSQNLLNEKTSLSDELLSEEISALPSSIIILLVEDNPTNMMFTGDYLTTKGFNLVTAENGLQAIELTQKHKPDLILMDIQMPELDGLETMRRLRTMPEFAAVPIIALTALAMPGDRERCLEAGASEYIAKPVSLKKLLQMIANLLK